MGTGCSTGNNTKTGVETENKTPSFKIVLVGSPGSGKTAVFHRYLKNQFHAEYTETKKPNIDSLVRKVNIPGPTLVSVTLWDLPGREELDVHKAYYRNLDAAIVVVDINDPTSIELAGVWQRDVINKATTTPFIDGAGDHRAQIIPSDRLGETGDKRRIPVLLLGNKSDQINEPRSSNSTPENKSEDLADVNANIHSNTSCESQKLLDAVLRQFRFIGSLMVSAKANDGSVDRALQALTRYLIDTCHPELVNRSRSADDDSSKHRKLKLKNTGIKEIDALLQECEIISQELSPLLQQQNNTEHEFVVSCYKQQLVPSSKSTVESCVVAIKRSLLDSGISLKIESHSNFCHLVPDKDSINEHTEQSIIDLIEMFNTKCVISSSVTLEKFPNLISQFSHIEAQIIETWDQLCASASGSNDDARITSVNMAKVNQLIVCDRAELVRIRVEAEQMLGRIELIKHTLTSDTFF